MDLPGWSSHRVARLANEGLEPATRLGILPDHRLDEIQGGRDIDPVIVVRRLARAISPARRRDDVLGAGRRIDEERRAAGIPVARAAVPVVDILRHVQPGIVEGAEARIRDLAVSRY